MNKISADLLLEAYANGVFPMSDSRDSQSFHWIQPKQRGLLFLDSFHVPSSLKKQLKQHNLEIRIDYDFDQVIAACAEQTNQREDTWINNQIIDVYTELFEKGIAHTIETWNAEKLVGGLYGLALGKVFFGESMFSRKPNTSKIALCYLVASLKMGGFYILDTQFQTKHLEQFGVISIPHHIYMKHLKKCLCDDGNFGTLPSYSELDSSLGLQPSSQRS